MTQGDRQERADNCGSSRCSIVLLLAGATVALQPVIFDGNRMKGLQLRLHVNMCNRNYLPALYLLQTKIMS